MNQVLQLTSWDIEFKLVYGKGNYSNSVLLTFDDKCKSGGHTYVQDRLGNLYFEEHKASQQTIVT